jgi:ElaB/YqjD/DUF883 family membrane-anchored ribosome-binding protein/plasmid stabilization system protein ParE
MSNDAYQSSGPADTIRDEGSQVVGETQRDAEAVIRHTGERAGEVVETARHEVRDVVDEAAAAIRKEADGRSRQVGHALHDLGRDLHRMAERSATDGERPPAADYVDALASSFDRMADTMEEGSSAVIDSVRGVAERRPGTFIAGSAFAGFVLGRALRNSEMHLGAGQNGSGGHASSEPIDLRDQSRSMPSVPANAEDELSAREPAYASPNPSRIPPPPPPGARPESHR